MSGVYILGFGCNKIENIGDHKMTFVFGLRKLQKIQYSYLIALPPGWVKDMEIEKGDSLKIEMLEDKTLRISPVPRETI